MKIKRISFLAQRQMVDADYTKLLTGLSPLDLISYVVTCGEVTLHPARTLYRQSIRANCSEQNTNASGRFSDDGLFFLKSCQHTGYLQAVGSPGVLPAQQDKKHNLLL